MPFRRSHVWASFCALLFVWAASLSGADFIHIAKPIAPSQRPSSFRMINEAGVPECTDNFGNPVTCDPSTMLQITYFGGHVIPNAKVYAVFWSSGVNATTQAGIGPFYQAITNSAWMDWLTEYSTDVGGGTSQIIGRGTYAGSITITPATVPHTCVAGTNGTPPPGTICIWDTDIPTELDAQITAGNVPPPDANTLYMFHFPATYVIQSFDRSPGNISDSCSQYCAYHGTYKRTGYGSVYYGVLPDVGANGCQSGCGAGTTFQNLTSVASHELGESITDAEVGLATSYASPLAWYDAGTNSQGEIGDMCNQVTDSLNALSGTSYMIQTLFSRTVWAAAPLATTAACVSTRFATNDFDVFFNPNTQSIGAGGNVAIPIHLETTSGTPSPVTLSISSASVLPTTVHPTLTQTAVTSAIPGGAAVANLDVAVDLGAAAASDQLLIVNATSGTLTHSAAVLLQVVTGSATASSNSPVCAGSSINLSTPTVSGATYAWTGPNGFTSTLQSPTIAAATISNAGSYTVTISVGGKPTAAGTTVVVVTPAIGTYLTTFIAAGAGKTVAPTLPPAGASVSVSESGTFTGTLSVNSGTGVVTISNAGPAGASPTIHVAVMDACGTTTSSFVLVINSFTDDPLVAGVTAKAVHLTELRNAVKAAAALAGQSPTFSDDPLPSGTVIKAVHIAQLRTALTNAFVALHLPLPVFTDPTLTPDVTAVKAVHFQELRNALK